MVDLRDKLETVCELAQKNLKFAAGKQKFHFDKKARHREIQVGDKVLVLLPTKANKLLLQWKGPFQVKEKFGHYDFRVLAHGKVKTYHANLLKKYIEREQVNSTIETVSTVVIEEENQVSDNDEMLTPNVKRKESVSEVMYAPRLTAQEKDQVGKLLKSFEDVLTDIPGRTSLVEHKIQVTTEVPIRQRQYPIPFAKLQTIKEEVDQMLKLGVIEPSDSPYASPIVLIAKKDNSTRFCIDMRAVNKITIFDAEPIPNVDEIFSKISGCRYFSKFDLSKGYWQVLLAEESRKVTAFQTPQGLYHFISMPFGLVNAGASFSRLMRMLLKGMNNVDNFIDDILVFTETWEEHIQVLEELFKRLRQANLTVRPSKCSVGNTQVECLGYIVGNDRLLPNPQKVEAIKQAQKPQTKKQIKSFLGMVGFYNKFIPNFSHVATPLTDMTKRNTPNKVSWSQEAEKAFESLKDALISQPILKLPNINGTFIIQSDASEYGLGGVLLQAEDNVKMPVAFASRKLTQSEKNYAVIEKECLAIVWTIQKFSRYLFGKEFLLETDHKPLVHLNTTKVANSRLMRWALLLQPYRFKIASIKGSENSGADFLSRI